MDRLSQADAVLAAALAHSPAVVVPGHVLSPMDCESTIPVARMTVAACDRRAHDGTPITAGSPDCDEDVLLEETVLDDTVLDDTVLDDTVLDDTVLDDTVLDDEMVRVSRVGRPAVRFGRTA